MITNFCGRGKVSTVVGGQFGSEAKGSAVAWLTSQLIESGRMFDIVTAGNGSQSGHTSIHAGKKRVLFHLPTASAIANEYGVYPTVYLNAGAVINPVVLEQELKDNPLPDGLFIHPEAAVITDECLEEEGKSDSSTTKIASTRKGVGAALARKILRKGKVAREDAFLKQFIRKLDLNGSMLNGRSVLVEIPQGVSLSLNQSGFYPYTTSRDCTPSAALSDAGIHPSFFGQSMVVMRTYPIRVGAIKEGGVELGQSGGCYADQYETSWEELGVEAEITTVTKRVRRVFTWSNKQLLETFSICRPDVLVLTFCNYLKAQHQLDEIKDAVLNVSKVLRMPPPKIYYEWGPTTDDIGEEYEVGGISEFRKVHCA